MQTRNLRWIKSTTLPILRGLHLTSLEVQPPDSPRLTLATDGELIPRDEAILLLQLAAEIEHALMVQYLYAAFSLETNQSALVGSNVSTNGAQLAVDWQSKIRRIAKQEMGHLITVQNLLRVIGGALHFGREDFPFTASGFYPFSFALEPLTKTTVAKFIAAERPEHPDRGILSESDEKEILERAEIDAGGMKVHRVGALYKKLIEVFCAFPTDGSIFLSDTDSLQASPDIEEWTGSSASNKMLVRNVTGDQAAMKAQAIQALKDIAEQGEGIDVDDPDNINSHFRVFLEIYNVFPEALDAGGTWLPSRPVPTNPTISGEEGSIPKSAITEPTSKLWAHLGNVRYRMLLLYLQHCLRTPASDDFRTFLFRCAFDEMRVIGLLATALTKLPRRPGVTAPQFAAAMCFDMPYTITLPERDVDCWRMHRDLLDCSDALLGEIGTVGVAFVDPSGLLKSFDNGRRATVKQKLP